MGTSTLRLVCFNLLEGLRPVGTRARPLRVPERRLLDRERAAAAMSVIEALNPDLLVLNEALFCRRYQGREVDYAGLFGFPHSVSALYDGAWGNAILSRRPIRDPEEMRIYNRGGLIAKVDTGDGALTVASYHPHPARWPGNKALDFVRLLGHRTGPRVLAGDLNCVHPADRPDRTALVDAFARFTEEPAETVDRFIDSGTMVFGALDRLGLRDAVPPAGRRFTIPTDLLDVDKGSAMRIDHVLASDELEVVGGEVVHGGATDQASDHYPVAVDFRLRTSG
ncbi:MAG: endonuclease/exonuclease/phosphatase family protein [Myxococcota bacterium]